MGKRKSTRKQTKKQKQTLDKTFACVFCNHEDTVTTNLDQENKIGHLSCSACSVQWSCPITVLSEPIDVYSEWIDACEAANQDVDEPEEEEEVEVVKLSEVDKYL